MVMIALRHKTRGIITWKTLSYKIYYYGDMMLKLHFIFKKMYIKMRYL